MNLSDFNKTFTTNRAFQTQVLAALSEEVTKAGIAEEITLVAAPDGSVREFLLGRDSANPGTQLAAASVAIKTLQSFGVDDLGGIATLKANIDSTAWNVVYKGGGWVVNGMQDGGHFA